MSPSQTVEPTFPTGRPKTALITGAGKGIGRALALRLVERGWIVYAVARTEADLKSLRADAGSKCLKTVVADLTQAASIRRIVAEVRRAGQNDSLDLLVCSAGAATLGGVRDTTPSAFSEMASVNLVAPFLCLHHAVDLLAAAKGSAVFLVSRAGRSVYSNAVGYGATKAGLVYLIKAAARDLADSGVRVIGVSPGAVATPMRRRVFPDEDQSVLMQPDEVVDAIETMLDPRLGAASGTILDFPF